MVNTVNNTLDFTALDPRIWHDVREIESLVSRMRCAKTIITSQGEYARMQWKSGYHDVLSWHCKNPKKAAIILDAIEEAFKEIPEGSSKEDIREFIKRNQLFIGSQKPDFDFSKSSIAYLANETFIRQFDNFLDIVKTKTKKLYKTKSTTEKTHKVNIAILTCNAGGGHRMVANALEKMLLSHDSDKFNARVINVDEMPGDSLDIVTAGAVKTHEIFSKFRCQENDGHKAGLYADLRWELHHFIPCREAHEVNMLVNQFGADIILNTIHHEINWLSPLADLNIPIAFINTDYELPPQLQELKSITASQNFRVFTPTDYALDIDGIVPTGYPIRAGFEQKITTEAAAAIRKKYQMGEHDTLVVMQMGSLAMGIEKQLQQQILETKDLTETCHVVYLCANNQKAKESIEKVQKKNTNSKLIMHAEGMLNDIELSHLYQTCTAVLGKPGGSTTAEIAATDAFLLVYDPLPWERPNLKYLETRNQATEIHSYKELTHFLNNRNSRTDHPASVTPSIRSKVLDWKTRIVEEITSIYDHKISQQDNDSIRVVKPFSNRKIEYIFLRHFKRALLSVKTAFSYLAFVFSQKMDSASLNTLYHRIRLWWKYV